MEFGLIALIIALAADFKFKQLRNQNIDYEEYQRLTYKVTPKETYFFLGAILVLIIADQKLPEYSQEIGFTAYGLIVFWLMYTRLRIYIEAKIKKINPEYTRYSLFSVIVVGIASVILINEEISKI